MLLKGPNASLWKILPKQYLKIHGFISLSHVAQKDRWARGTITIMYINMLYIYFTWNRSFNMIFRSQQFVWNHYICEQYCIAYTVLQLRWFHNFIYVYDNFIHLAPAVDNSAWVLNAWGGLGYSMAHWEWNITRIFVYSPPCHYPNYYLSFCQFDHWEQTSIQFESKYRTLIWQNAFENIVYKTWDIFFRLRYVHISSGLDISSPPLLMLPLIARFMGPAWGPSGADRTQVGPMLAHEICYLGRYHIDGFVQKRRTPVC